MSTDYTSSFRNDCYKFDTFEEIRERAFRDFHFRLIRDYIDTGTGYDTKQFWFFINLKRNLKLLKFICLMTKWLE